MHQELVALTNTEVWGITIGAVAFFFVLGLLVLIRLIGKNSEIRFGFFIEHGIGALPDYSDDADTMVKWPEKPKDGA